MSELLPVLEEVVREAEAGRPCALCTVVETRGSTPQAAGAAMVVRADMRTVGTLGGGCVEAEVRTRAFELLGRGESALLDYVLDHDFGWDDGLICGGRMFVAVTPYAAGAALDPIRQALAQGRSRRPADFVLRVPRETGEATYRVHLETPPVLLIAGAGHVGQAVARLAVDLDFAVTVIDERADFASPARFDPRVGLVVDDIAAALRSRTLAPADYVVIVTRGHQHDEQALDAVIRSEAGYIGLIGSKRKSRMIFDDLKARGVPEELLARVKTPIGLPIRAVTVSEIAVSIAAELVQHRRSQVPKLVEGPFQSVCESRQ